MNNEIQRIISGKVAVKYGATIYTVACNLRGSETAGSLVKTDKHFKIEETKRLRQIIEAQNMWVKDIDLNNVRQFMMSNGFNLIRNNDYINPELGIIIEDLHDENVLTNNGILYFIDTVFYIQ
jgi:pantothenate kinase